MEFHWMSHCLFTSSTCKQRQKVKQMTLEHIYRKLKYTETFPYGKRGWAVRAKKTHILSLLLQKLDLLFIHLNITRFGRGFLCSFSTLWGTQNIPKSTTFFHYPTLWGLTSREVLSHTFLVKRFISCISEREKKFKINRFGVWMGQIYLNGARL